jgi:hypothetical protein
MNFTGDFRVWGRINRVWGNEIEADEIVSKKSKVIR